MELWTRCPNDGKTGGCDLCASVWSDGKLLMHGLVRVPFDEAAKRGVAEYARLMGIPPENAEMYFALIDAVLRAALGEGTE